MRGDFIAPLSSPFIVPRGEYADFIGVNYYSRSTVSGCDGVRKTARKRHRLEIYPEGASVRCTEKLLKVLPVQFG